LVRGGNINGGRNMVTPFYQDDMESGAQAYNSRSLQCGLSNMQSYRTSSGAAHVVFNLSGLSN
jgi:hypothetical protein